MIHSIDFPRLTADNHRVTSPPDDIDNCIAWAAGDAAQWWQPGTPYYWPVPGWPKDDAGMGGLVLAFAALGYVECEDASHEPGWEKVALYGTGLFWKHAARQLSSGKWTSKLGGNVDIEHDTLEAVSGGLYGEVMQIMRRPTASTPSQPPADPG